MSSIFTCLRVLITWITCLRVHGCYVPTCLSTLNYVLVCPQFLRAYVPWYRKLTSISNFQISFKLISVLNWYQLMSVHLKEVNFWLSHSGVFVHVKLFLFISRKSNFVHSITNKVQTNKQLFKVNMNKKLSKANMMSFWCLYC